MTGSLAGSAASSEWSRPDAAVRVRTPRIPPRPSADYLDIKISPPIMPAQIARCQDT